LQERITEKVGQEYDGIAQTGHGEASQDEREAQSPPTAPLISFRGSQRFAKHSGLIFSQVKEEEF
jgi:hypothetical protein